MRPFDTQSIRSSLVSKSKLYEAAEFIRQNLYLAKYNDISQIIQTSTSAQSLEASVSADLQSRQKELDGIQETILGTLPATKSEIESTSRATVESLRTKAATSLLGTKNVGLFDNNSFYPEILKGADGDKKRSEILHICVTDTGQSNNFSSRGAEYVAIFSNLIPSVELSKCVPYFNMRLVQNVPNDSRVKMPFLILDTFLGAVRVGSGHATSPSDTPATYPVTHVNPPTSKVNSTVSGMELFQSPQTLIRPGIDALSNYAANRGIRVLDPMQPLASIESLNFDVSALSQNFMTTSTKIDMTIILHDKSRLAEISPLVAPGIYPTLQAEIEWGWSHPDSSDFSSNQYAKFMNALRNKQTFCVNSVTFSNRDATSLSIRLQLTGLGEFVASNTSVYTGDYVSYELIRARMNQLFTIIDERAKDDSPPKQKFVGAYEQVVTLSNFETSDKWILYDHYRTLADMIDGVKNGTTEVDKLVDFYSQVLSGQVPSGASSTPKPSNLSVSLQSTLRRALEPARVEKSPYVQLYGEKIFSQFMQTVVKEMFSDGGSPTISGAHITFGDALYRFFSVPVSLTDVYDEIRVTTFDFNDHAGRMAGINIGAFPILASEAASSVILPKMTAQRAVQELIKIVNNPAAVPYGIKKALIDKQDKERKIGEDETLDADEANNAREEIQRQFESALKTLYEEKARSGLSVSFEPKFISPRVKMHTEVSSVKSGDVTKQILNIFIYDDANTGYRGTNLISSIMQQDSGIVRIFKPGKDLPEGATTDNLASYVQRTYSASKSKSSATNADETIVSIDRDLAKKIITLTIPTLRVGTEGSLITNASYNSSAAGDLSNINLLRGIKNSGGSSAAGSFPGIEADLFVIPASLTITMPGMPIINRGQTYFVDFGTGTTLDNTYTVMSVKHSMKLGNFTTTVVLNVTNQGTIKSVTSKLQTDLRLLQKYTYSKDPASNYQKK